MKSYIARIGVIVAGMALAVFGLFGHAEARNDYVPQYVPGAPQLEYPGPFSGDLTPSPDNPNSLGFGGVATTVGTTEGGTGGGLALTGSSANLTVALGIGLVAAGSTAVVAARKRDQLD